MINFIKLEKDKLNIYEKKLFDILYCNMNKIAPTNEGYEEDYRIWKANFDLLVHDSNREIILIFSSEKLIGYFMYSIFENIWRMEELEIIKEFHGKDNIFRKLFSYMFSTLPNNIKYVKSYSHKNNTKSQNILKHLGLSVINENSTTINFYGEFSSLKTWYNKKAT